MKNNFKVGDVVICVEPKNGKFGGAYWSLDQKFEISHISYYTQGDVLWPKDKDGNPGSQGVYSYAVELVNKGDNYEIY